MTVENIELVSTKSSTNVDLRMRENPYLSSLLQSQTTAKMGESAELVAPGVAAATFSAYLSDVLGLPTESAY